MNRLECLGTSSATSQKQLTVEVTSAHETHKPNDTAGKKTVTDKHWSFPVHALPHSVQVSYQESQSSGFVGGDMLKTEEWTQKESINTTPRNEEQAQSTAVPDEELKMKYLRKAHSPDSAVTGETTHASPPTEPIQTRGEPHGEEEQTDDEDEDLRAPVELIIEFLRAVMDRDFQLASRLCQMILIYEPENPEASEFLPLIQKKLLEEQETDQSNSEDEDGDDDDDDDDDSDDSENDEESSPSSSCSSSSSSSPSDDDNDEEEEKQIVNRHKLCPPSHVSP